jgi:hypothetical protein
MSAGKYDLYIEQGATFTRNCTYTDSTNTPINLTGMSVEGHIRRSYSDPTIAQVITCTILDQSVPANVGKFLLFISHTDTASLAVTPAHDYQNTPSYYTYDVELLYGGMVKRLLQGTVIVSPEVTR